MQAYTWPGNVRELQNIVERAVVLCRGELVEKSLIEPWLLPMGAMVPAAQAAMAPLPEPKPIATASVDAAGAGILATTTPGAGPIRVDSDLIPMQGRVLEEIERDAIVRTLTRFGGHRQRTAQALGIGVRTLGLKLKKWKQMQLVDAGL
ncbi:MAG: hypothetical protein K2Q20_13850 [Phycisphaerales bacterium]|nr:hypothetical protein [Phycisphaerales bacterium]